MTRAPRKLDCTVHGQPIVPQIRYANQAERPKLSWLCADGQRVVLDIRRQGTAKTFTIVLETPEEAYYLILTPWMLEKVCRKIERRVLA